MTTFIYANDINTTLSGSLTSGSTSMTLADASKLPSSIPSGSVLVITLRDQATKQTSEIVYASSVSGATLSGLARGQEGTSALSWTVGDYAYSPPTAGQMGNLAQLSQFPSSLSTSGYKKYPDPNSPSGYFIEQWLSTTINATSGATVSTVISLPIAFPNAQLSQMIQFAGNTPPTVLANLTVQPNALDKVTAYVFGNASTIYLVDIWVKGH